MNRGLPHIRYGLPATLVVFFALCPPAAADKAVAAAEKTQGLQSALKGLKWAATHGEVQAHFERASWDEYRNAKKQLAGPLEIDRLREQTQVRVEELRLRYLDLPAGSTHYRVSIIDQEFKRGTGESVQRIDTEDGQEYWFFIKDQLWKRVIALEAAAIEGKELAGFAAKLRGLYGQPVDREFSKLGGKDMLTGVKWSDDATELALRDRRDPYGTFTLTFTSRDLGGRLAELRGELAAFSTGDTESDTSATDSLIDDILTPPEVDTEAAVVDEILGRRPARVNPPDAGPKGTPDAGPASEAERAVSDEDAPLIY